MKMQEIITYDRTSKNAYITRKILSVVPIYLAITILSYLATGVVSEDVYRGMWVSVPQSTTYEELLASLRHRLGRDQPIYIGYLRWMGLIAQEDGRYHGVLQGDLGQSIWKE